MYLDLSAVLAHMLSEDGEHVSRERVEAIVRACDMCPPQADLSGLFQSKQMCRVEEFQRWLTANPHMASFTTWLLVEELPGFSLETKEAPPTFYQTLAQKYQSELHQVTSTVLWSHYVWQLVDWLFYYGNMCCSK